MTVVEDWATCTGVLIGLVVRLVVGLIAVGSEVWIELIDTVAGDSMVGCSILLPS